MRWISYKVSQSSLYWNQFFTKHFYECQIFFQHQRYSSKHFKTSNWNFQCRVFLGFFLLRFWIRLVGKYIPNWNTHAKHSVRSYKRNEMLWNGAYFLVHSWPLHISFPMQFLEWTTPFLYFKRNFYSSHVDFQKNTGELLLT